MVRADQGSLLYKYWLSIIDDRTTIICADAAGQRRRFHDLFDTMAGALDGPPAHWGCRSHVDFWVEGQAVPDLRERAIRELARRQLENPEKFAKSVTRAAKLRPPGQRQLKGRVRRFIRLTRQKRQLRDTLKRVEARVNQELRLGRDTQSLHRDPLTGKWNLRMKDRPAMHNTLIARLDRAKDAAGRLVRGTQIEQGHEAIIVSGLPQAGTGEALQSLGVDVSRYLASTADDFKVALKATGRMPRWAGLSQQETAGLLHEESEYLVRRLAQRAMRRGTNMIVESDGNSAALANRIVELKAHGYNVKLVHVDVDVWTSTNRAVQWADQTGSFTPTSRIERAWDPVYGSVQRRAVESVKDVVDSWVVFDNEIGLVQVASGGGGGG